MHRRFGRKTNDEEEKKGENYRMRSFMIYAIKKIMLG
jgi:hypothetical protein